MGAEQKLVEPSLEQFVFDDPNSLEDDHPQDECGVLAVYMPGENIGLTVYEGLKRLQHRGQSGAGVAYRMEDTLIVHKGTGLVDEAVKEISPQVRPTNLHMMSSSKVAIGHTRYSTAESVNAMQPILGLAHNGHIETIHETAATFGVETEAGDSDSGILAKIVNQRYEVVGAIEDALADVLPYVEGSYSLVAIEGDKIVGARDPWGTHPLQIAKLGDDRGYMIASESSAFKFAGVDSPADIRDFLEGEIIVVDGNGAVSSQINRKETPAHCMFEYIYFANPISVINGISVVKARRNMGAYLATDSPVEADVVVGVPSSGLAAAKGYAHMSGLEEVDGLIKNESKRSFLARGATREEVLRHKFDVDNTVVEGKRVVLVDDSLIKGNTMRVLVTMLKEAGAREVHFRSAAPQYKNPCYGGMDTRDTSRLIARYNSDQEIAELIGVDSIGFNKVGRINQSIQAARVIGSSIISPNLCTACTTGDYPYRVPDLSAPREMATV
jgi:amidophosphoribosyltransferase